MPMTPTTTVDPNVMTTNWSNSLQNPQNQAKLIYKYSNPKALYNANPQAAQAALLTGVQRAVTSNKYANSMASSDPNAAATAMANYGGTNWSNAGVNKKAKFQKVSTNLASAISAVKAQVNSMPKGKGANNQARMNAWYQGMSSYYGKIK
jgi:hypothetical protein